MPDAPPVKDPAAAPAPAAPPAPVDPPPPVDPKQMLAEMREELCEVLGLDVGCTDEELQQGFQDFLAKLQETLDKRVSEAAEAARTEGEQAGRQSAEQEFCSTRERFETEAKTLKATIKDLEGKLSKFESAARESEAKRFETEVDGILGGLVRDQKLLPSEVTAQKQILMSADRVKKHRFEAKPAKEGEAPVVSERTMFESIVEGLKARPALKNFEELSAGSVEDAPPPEEPAVKRRDFESTPHTIDARSAELNRRTEALVAEAKKAGKTLTFGAAMVQASKSMKDWTPTPGRVQG